MSAPQYPADVARRSTLGTAGLRVVAGLFTMEKALWGVSREVDEVTSRTLVINAEMPEDVQQRMLSILEQQQAHEGKCHTLLGSSRLRRWGVRGGEQLECAQGQRSQEAGLNGRRGFFRAAAVLLGLRRGLPELTCADEALVARALVLLPKSIKRVCFSNFFNQHVAVPSTVEELIVGWRYNRPIALPPSLRKLIFLNGAVFDQTIGLLPSTLEVVVFPSRFDEPVVLPSSLKEVEFGLYFDRPVVFPPSVRKIRFGQNFNRANVVLPTLLEELVLGLRYSQRIVLPSSLKRITFGSFFDRSDVTLPSSLVEIELGFHFNQHIVFPASVKKITMGAFFNRPDVVLPGGLEELILGDRFNQPIVLPRSLKKLTFSSRFNQPLDLPPALESLVFTYGFQEPQFNLPLDLPASLRVLSLGRAYTHPLESLPAGLQWLGIGDHCRLPAHLPEGLKVNYLGPPLAPYDGPSYRHPDDSDSDSMDDAFSDLEGGVDNRIVSADIWALPMVTYPALAYSGPHENEASSAHRDELYL